MKSNKKSKPTVDYINYIAKTEDLPQLIELIEVMEQNDKYKYFHNDVERKSKNLNKITIRFVFIKEKIFFTLFYLENQSLLNIYN